MGHVAEKYWDFSFGEFDANLAMKSCMFSVPQSDPVGTFEGLRCEQDKTHNQDSKIHLQGSKIKHQFNKIQHPGSKIHHLPQNE